CRETGCPAWGNPEWCERPLSDQGQRSCWSLSTPVIPGRCEASSPESRDSGSGPSNHPGMTEIQVYTNPGSIRGPAEPKGIFHDPQADLAAQRHQRLRMELHPADRQALVLDCHRDPVLGTGGHGEHLRHAVAGDIERVVAA